MRALIIGLDAAEYDIIANGSYPHLKQIEYGKVEINVRPIFTPVVWASFITGVSKEKHGVYGLHKWRVSPIDKLRNWSLNATLPRSIRKHWLRGQSVLESLGINPRFYERSDLRVSTIFDCVDKHVAVSVPSYNEDSVNQILKKKEVDALRSGDRKLMKETEEFAWQVFREERKKVLALLGEDWDIFMAHFYTLDPLQHLFWYDAERMSQAYQEMDNTMRLIQEKMRNVEHLSLIVSDHGHKKGFHTPYGFYSSNTKLDLKDPKITDFADTIRRYLGLPTREEELKVYRHLKSLGYA